MSEDPVVDLDFAGPFSRPDTLAAPSLSDIGPMWSKGLRYSFAHVMLPILAFADPDVFYPIISGSNIEEYLRKIWCDLALVLGPGESPEGLGVFWTVLRHDTEAWVIHLPKPMETPEAFLVAAVFQFKKQSPGKEVERFRYFTLELGRNTFDQSEQYFLCEWVGSRMMGGEHRNHGLVSDNSERTFIAGITRLIS